MVYYRRTVRDGEMKLTDLKSNEQVLANDLEQPSFRAEWERTSVARALAVQVLAFRTKNDLSQRELAGMLGISQPHVSRVEAGIHNPDIETLSRIADVMRTEIQVTIPPQRREPTLRTHQPRRRRPIRRQAEKLPVAEQKTGAG